MFRALTLVKLAALSLLAALAASVAVAAPSAEAANGRLGGKVLSGKRPLAGLRVRLLQARPGGKKPRSLATATSRGDGRFALRYRNANRNAAHYLVAFRPGRRASSLRLAASLGYGAVPRRATVNERTTVAIAFSMAQFITDSGVAGPNPGLKNAAAIGADLVDLRGGGIAPVLRRHPNGASTSTLATFDTLANLLSLCRRPGGPCAKLLRLASVPGRGPAADTLAAATAIARYPWHNAGRLWQLALSSPRPFRPALGAGERPAAWTLALRFEGRAGTVDGPGAIAIDEAGGVWVTNAYEYGADPAAPACGGETLLRFTPTGHAHPDSPYRGGGLDGAGGGIGFDPRGRLWVGNTGLAGLGCADRPLGNSVSLFDSEGTPLSPPLLESPPFSGNWRGGFEAGGIERPQGTVADLDGNLWVASCGGGTVTRYANGLTKRARNLGPIDLQRPFGIAVGRRGNVFVTGNGNDAVATLASDGSVLELVSGGGLKRPLGVATDSRGFAWVADAGEIVPPCAQDAVEFEQAPGGDALTLIGPEGARLATYTGAGLSLPWGVAVDGADTVWVANYGGGRLSHLCGTVAQRCPAGRRGRGASISPPEGGYRFDGLSRNTGIAIDPSGNVWLSNAAERDSLATNPGGRQIVVFLGLATPIRTPLIGPPSRP